MFRKGAGPVNVLDQYIMGRPTDQNIADLFDGEWSSIFPESSGIHSRPGVAALFDDMRIQWAERVLGGFRDREILELGPLEGGHTYMLHRSGAKAITAIEANSRAFLKCLCVKELFELNRAQFKVGDFIAFLQGNTRKYDVTLASGVLYHMPDPMLALELICASADGIFIWTHYFDEQLIQSNADVARRFSARAAGSHRGFEYEYSTHSYRKALDWSGFCGGSEPQSRWLTRNSLIAFLKQSGFVDIVTEFEQPTHPNGPALALCAQRPQR